MMNAHAISRVLKGLGIGLIFLIPYLLPAQVRTDSLRQVLYETTDRHTRLRTLNELVNHFRINQYDSAQIWSEKLVEEAISSLQTDIDTFEVGLAYLQQAKTFLMVDSLSHSIKAYETAAGWFREGGYNYQLAEIYTDIGQIHLKQGEIDTAVSKYQEARILATRYRNRYRETGDQQRLQIYESQLAHACYALADLYIEVAQPDSGLPYLEQAADLYQGLGDYWGMGNCLYTRAQYHRDHSADYSAAFRDFMAARDLYEELDDTYNVCFITGELGTLFRSAGNAEKAREYYLSAQALAREIHDQELVAHQFLNLSQLELDQSNSKSAASLAREALAILRPLQFPDLLTETYLYLGTAFQLECLVDSAQIYLERALKSGTNANSWQGVSRAYTIQAKVADVCESDVGIAIDELTAATLMAQRYHLPQEELTASLQLADVLIRQGRYSVATELLTNTQTLAKSLQLPEEQLESLHLLSLLALKSGRPQLAEQYIRQYEEMREQVETYTSRESFELSYEVSSLQSENQELEMENERKELQLRISRITYQALGGGLVLIIILALVLFISRNQLKQKNELITFYNQEARHRTQNNLQMLENLMHLQLGRLRHERARSALASAISRVEAISNLVKQFYDPTDSDKRSADTLNLKPYLEKRIDELFHVAGLDTQRVALTKDIEAIETGIDTALPLGLIVNECLTNAIKYAIPQTPNPELALKLISLENHQLQLTISDNGPGIPTDTEALRPGSFGLSLVRTLVRKLKGDLSIETEGGTRLSVVFPRG